MPTQKKTGELLIQQGLITEEQLYKAMLTQKALSAQRSISKPIGEVLIDLELVKEEQVMAIVSSKLGVPYIDIDQYEIAPEILTSIPEKIARAKKLIPVSKIEGALTVAMADPSDLSTVEEIEFLCGSEVITVLASKKGIIRAINRSYPRLKELKTKKKKKKKKETNTAHISIDSNKLPGEIREAYEREKEELSSDADETKKFMDSLGMFSEDSDYEMETPSEQESSEPVNKQRQGDYESAWEDQMEENQDYEEELADIWEEVAKSEMDRPKTDVINVGSVVVKGEENDEGDSYDTQEITDNIITDALNKEANMVYLEYSNDMVKLRYRIGNKVIEGDNIDAEYGRALSIHFKRLADIKIREDELPQSGRAPVNIGGKRLMLIISSLPTISGETLAIRILEEKPWLKLQNLGFTRKVYDKIENVIERKRGSIIITGPARSGKTTTMYSILRHFDANKLKIIDIQSNFEHHLPHINQVQIDLQKGFSSSDALSAAIEHHPDIVLLEELNDYLSSEMALRVGLSSLLITSTTGRSVAEAVFKLKDITIDPFLIGTSISAVINQRVVRKVCKNCKVKYTPSNALVDKIKRLTKMKEVHFYKGKGCDQCSGTGFVGDVGVFEFVVFNNSIRSAIIAGVPREELKKKIEKNRVTSIWKDAMSKVLKGVTTFEEVTRVL